MGFWILVITCGVATTLIVFRLTSWGGRTYSWLQSIIATTVDTGNARLSDFISLTSISLTVVGVLVGWFTVRLQTQHGTVQQEATTYDEQIEASQQELSKIRIAISQPSSAIMLRIVSPAHDKSLIGVNATLQWQYAVHNDGVNYLIELIQRDSDRPVDPQSPSTVCDFRSWSTCRFYATNAAWERSAVPLKEKSVFEGDFLWRVAPAKTLATGTSDQKAEEVWDWSELGSFSIYPTLGVRMIRTRTIRVGTSYSGNDRFAEVNDSGEPAGHDIDLSRLLVEGCVTPAKGDDGGVALDALCCSASLKAYQQHSGLVPDNACRPSAGRFCASVIPYSSISDGLAALQRRELDIYVGSLTKSAGRESDVTRFTDGYGTIYTRLYAHIGGPSKDFERWINRNRRIGVIEHTTNHIWAKLLVEEESIHDRISIVTFASLPELLSALAERSIDGALVDSSVEHDVVVLGSDIKVMDNLRSNVWRKYHSQIGATTEELAFAVALDDDTELQSETLQSWKEGFRHLLGLSEAKKKSDLYTAVQEALRLPEMKGALSVDRKVHGVEYDPR